jgi:hypothetical protein
VDSSSFPSILALDFTGIGAAQSFKAVLADAPADRVRRVDPVRGHLDGRPTLAEQADGIRRAGDPPDFVLGYCTAALLAATVAESYRRSHGIEPQVVLYDPDPVNPDYLEREFAVLFETLGGEPAQVPGGPDALDRFEDALGTRRPALLREYDEDPGVVDYLLARHRAWLRFLAASASGTAAALEGQVSVLTGRPAVDLAPIVSRPERHRTRRFDAPEGGLLVHPAVREATVQVLRG